ncbi:MAG: glutamate--tRNA ligase family protein [Phycisphaerales bacterium]
MNEQRPSSPTPVRPVSRLAPSPTGALHLGNARTFLVNWALARSRGWTLLLRIEDLDTPRTKPGAAVELIDTLTWLGIDWDPWTGSTSRDGRLVQSDDLEPYRTAMRALASRGLAYPCQLTRAQIESAASAPQEGAHDVPFPAALRPASAGTAFDFDELNSAAEESARPNWRFIAGDGETAVADQFTGCRSFDVSRIIGDFVLWTRRDQPSYQLAVVVDDHRQGVTEVVRGDDLLDSAARQLLLYRALGYTPEPRHTHLPLVIGEDGKRLAKRHGDTRLDHYRSRGVPPESVIGLVARWSGVLPRDGERRPMSITEFRDRFKLSKMPMNTVVFTREDDEWLRSTARRTH